jgi:sterol desaturase/sphingolipid hydroxylase (fatty acid hydroxylase superfamily)
MPEFFVAGSHRRVVALLAGLLILVEYLWQRLRGRQDHDWREAAASTAILFGQLVTKGLTNLVLAPLLLWVYRHRWFDMPVNDVARLATLFVAVEFSYYWFHRASHHVPWLWATHCVHHSSTHLNLTAAYRLGWTNLLSGGWLFFVPLVWIGYPPAAVFGLVGVGLLYQFLLHTEAVGRLGPLEWVLNTPSHHRVHHAAEADLLDRNFGAVLIVFDRLFGSFAEEPAGRRFRYGLADAGDSGGRYNPVTIAFAGWRQLFANLTRSQGVAQAVRAVLGSP